MSSTHLDQDILLDEANRLAPLPPTATQLAAVISQPDWEIEDVMRIVSLDQALTSRVLRIANSGAHARLVPIGSVQEAVVRMGSGNVACLAIGMAVKEPLQDALPEYGLDRGALWRHSVASALAAETLRSACGSKIPQESFTAALLHDIGKLLLAPHLDADRAVLIKEMRHERGMTRTQAEAEVLGISHASLGGLLAQHWKLPESIVRGIAYHHDPKIGSLGEASWVPYAVHLADTIAQQTDPTDDSDARPMDELGSTQERLGLTQESLIQVSEEVATRFADTLAWYS